MKKIWIVAVLFFLPFVYAQEMDKDSLEERLKEVYVRLFELKKEAEENGFSQELSNKLTELSRYAEELEALLEEGANEEEANEEEANDEPMMEESSIDASDREKKDEVMEGQEKKVKNVQQLRKRLEKSLNELQEAKAELENASEDEKEYLEVYVASLSHDVRNIQEKLKKLEKQQEPKQKQKQNKKNDRENNKWRKEMQEDDRNNNRHQHQEDREMKDRWREQDHDFSHHPPRENRQFERFEISPEELEVIEREKMLERESRELVYKIHTSKGMEKEEFKQKLVRTLNEIFEIREHRREREIHQLEEKLNRSREVLFKRQENKDRIIEMRMEMLIGEAEEWKW